MNGLCLVLLKQNIDFFKPFQRDIPKNPYRFQIDLKWFFYYLAYLYLSNSISDITDGSISKKKWH